MDFQFITSQNISQNIFSYNQNIFPPKFSKRETNDDKETNFSNFINESNWNLQIKSNDINKKEDTIIDGKINKKDFPNENYLNIIFPNIENSLPINIKENQILTFNSSEKKIFLKLNFPIYLKNGFNLRNVNKDLINQMFDIKLTGNINQKNIFSEPVNFKVKGFEILKAIIKTLNNRETIPNTNDKYIKIRCSVFNDIQMTFLIEFQISFENLKTIYTFPIKKINSINKFGIKISKIILIYCLSYKSLFNKRNILINNYYNNIFYQDNLKYNILLRNEENKQKIYNLNSFINTTTPIIYENDDFNIINIFNLFIKYSLFGIDCFFKDEYNNDEIIKYFPFLSSIFIENEKVNVSHSMSTNSTTNSFNDNYTEKKTQNLFFFKENNTNIFEIPSYYQQLQSFLENNIEINDITLNEVTDNSYFSLIWIPYDYKYNNNLFCKKIPIYQVKYKFKFQSQCSFNVNYIPIIKINEINIKGNIEYTIFDDYKCELLN